jgi:hypothetical protein
MLLRYPPSPRLRRTRSYGGQVGGQDEGGAGNEFSDFKFDISNGEGGGRRAVRGGNKKKLKVEILRG